MFVVTVDFLIKQEHVVEFIEIMNKQADNSLHKEEGCLQFDVCQDPRDGRRIFLYEVYKDSDAFALHLKTDHFLAFNKTVSPWTASKSDQKWERIAG
jgi:quinol monooxygenase YgiN